MFGLVSDETSEFYGEGGTGLYVELAASPTGVGSLGVRGAAYEILLDAVAFEAWSGEEPLTVTLRTDADGCSRPGLTPERGRPLLTRQDRSPIVVAFRRALMKREALGFFRILPAGAADIGDDVSREDLRAAGMGDWSLRDVGCDDLTDVLPPLDGEYDEPVRLDDRAAEPGESVVELKMGKAG